MIVHSLWRARVCDLAGYTRTRRGLVLRYHSICADVNARPDYVSSSISVPVKLFDQQVARLQRKYSCMTLDEVVDHLERRRPLPPRAVALTFDDGYLDNYLFALPVLVKYRVPATIYLVSSTLTSRRSLWTSLLRYAFMTTRLKRALLPDGKGARTDCLLEDYSQRNAAVRQYTNVLNVLSASVREQLLDELLRELRIDDIPDAERWFLSGEQVREMKGHGVSFGAHTVSHPNLTGIDRDEARSEIDRSKSELEACLGEPLRHFSYPNSGGLYPHVDDFIESLVRRAGFRSAVTSVENHLTETDNMFRIGRVGVNRAHSELAHFSFWLEWNRIRRSGDPLNVPL